MEDVSVVEGAGAATVSVELNVSANCDVYVSATDGTAEMFVDYLFDPAVISFTEGGATMQTFDVLIEMTLTWSLQKRLLCTLTVPVKVAQQD